MEEKQQQNNFTPFFLALAWLALAAGLGVALYLYAFPVFEVYAKLLGVILFCALPIYLVAVKDGLARTPEPEKGWRGVEVPVSEVYPTDFATREEYEAFRRTSKYVTAHVTEKGIDFGAIDEEKAREYLARIDRERKARRRAGVDLEID